MGYERELLTPLSGYVPGKQPTSSEVTKLNTNENPYPPTDAVMAALGAVQPEDLRRYPSPTAEAFRELAAQVHQRRPEQLIATNGGDELLRLAITTFVDPGRPIGYLEPSYSLYPVLASLHGSPVETLPLQPDWALPENTAERFNEAGVQLSFVVNPHAPSGTLLSGDTLRTLAAALDGVLVIDEAYVDFVDPALEHDLLPLIDTLDNVLLLRTLSKGYSLAGLRFGYGIGCADLIRPMMEKTRDSYNMDAIAQRLGAAALQSRQEASRSWQRIREQRTLLQQALHTLGWACPESETNFLLPQVAAGQNAAQLHAQLEARGVLVRYFDHQGLRDRLRITVGTAKENRKLLEALRSILGR